MYCQEINCYQQAISEESYCSNHENVCWESCFPQGCSKRISSDNWYCAYHHEYYKNLVRQRTGLANIQDVKRITTWWSNNLATVVNGTGPYSIWLIVYEPARNNGKIEEILEKFEINEQIVKKIDSSYDKYDVEDAKILSWRLNGSSDKYLNSGNPILYVHPKANDHANFNEIICEPYVKKVDLPYEKEIRTRYVDMYGREEYPWRNGIEEKYEVRVPNKNPENYLKPLDVVWVKKITPVTHFYHVGVYLGNNQVCHYSGEDKKQYKAKVIITSWKDFVEGYDPDVEIVAYHQMIPFRCYEQVAQQIDLAKANYETGKYCLANNNCEHRANSFVFGIDYSEQIRGRAREAIDNCKSWRKECTGDCKIGIANNGKGSTIKLVNEIEGTNNEESSKSAGYWCEEIKKEYEAKTVVPSKDCRIM